MPRFRPVAGRANDDILRDLPYGQGMRHLTLLLSRYGLLAPMLRAAQRDRSLRAALFDAVSAHALRRSAGANMRTARRWLCCGRCCRLGERVSGW